MTSCEKICNDGNDADGNDADGNDDDVHYMSKNDSDF